MKKILLSSTRAGGLSPVIAAMMSAASLAAGFAAGYFAKPPAGPAHPAVSADTIRTVQAEKDRAIAMTAKAEREKRILFTRIDALSQEIAALRRPEAAKAEQDYFAQIKAAQSIETITAALNVYLQNHADLSTDVRISMAPKQTEFWYRLMIGPPTTREKARELCASLKSEFEGCFPNK